MSGVRFDLIQRTVARYLASITMSPETPE